MVSLEMNVRPLQHTDLLKSAKKETRVRLAAKGSAKRGSSFQNWIAAESIFKHLISHCRRQFEIWLLITFYKYIAPACWVDCCWRQYHGDEW